MTDDERSRSAWPAPGSTGDVVIEAIPVEPPWLLKRIRLLTWAVFVLGVCLLAIGTLLVLVILDRSSYRDEENARLEQRLEESFREGMCTALDALPEGGPVDRVRAEYECGPGTPVADLPPEERDWVQRTRPPATSPSPAGPAASTPVTPPPAPPPRPASEPQPAAPTGSPPADPEPAPPDDPAPTDPVADLICIVPLLCS